MSGDSLHPQACAKCGHVQDNNGEACYSCGASDWMPTQGEPRAKALMPDSLETL